MILLHACAHNPTGVDPKVRHIYAGVVATVFMLGKNNVANHNQPTGLHYSSTCHERTPSGPGKSVRTLQVAARHRDGRAGG